MMFVNIFYHKFLTRKADFCASSTKPYIRILQFSQYLGQGF